MEHFFQSQFNLALFMDLSRNLFNSGHIHTFTMPGRTSGLISPYQTKEEKFISMYVHKQFSRYSPSVFWRQSFRNLSVVALKSLMYSAGLENEETLRQSIFDAFQITCSCPGTFETVRHCVIRRVDTCIVSAARYFEIFLKIIMTW